MSDEEASKFTNTEELVQKTQFRAKKKSGRSIKRTNFQKMKI